MNSKRQPFFPALVLMLLGCGAVAAGEGSGDTYAIRPAAPGAGDTWKAPNPRHRFEARFDAGRLRVEPDVEDKTWSFDMSLLRYGRDGYMLPAKLLGDPSPDQNRIEFVRDNLSEWYLNTRSGLEQGFDIGERPPGPEGLDLVLEMEMKTDLHPVFSHDGQAVEFFRGRDLALRYSKLVVTDITGVRLPSRMEGFASLGERGIRLVIDDSDAVYPIVVDPLVTTASWSAYGPSDNAAFGGSVAAAGDVNGDGYGDVIVGSPLATNGENGEGMAFVYLGSASGLASTPVWSAEGDQMNARFGYSVSTAGDVNADGYADVLVGCRLCNGTGSAQGQVFVYFGSAAGPSTTPDHTFTGAQNNEMLGTSVSTAGDFNGDGYSDVILGAPGWNNSTGRAYMYGGSAGGLTQNLPQFDGQSMGEEFGRMVAGGGDMDGDGYSEVAIAAPLFGGGTSDGKVRLVHGAQAGSGPIMNTQIPTGASDAQFGAALAFVGDTTGDGLADLAVGAPNESVAQFITGRVFVFSGGLSSYWSVAASNTGESFGTSVACAGDIDDDGRADVIIGDSAYASNAGVVWAYQDPAFALTDSTVWYGPIGNDNDDRIGISVTATDVNGDGRPDMIFGGSGEDESGIDNKGMVVAYHSGPAGAEMEPPDNIDILAGVPYLATVGDLNGDGFEDVAAGRGPEDWTKIYDGSASGVAQGPNVTLISTETGSEFGYTVAGAGDVNGDGYGDLLVSSPLYDGGETDEGRAQLFQGGPAGVNSAHWTFVSGQAGAILGHDGLAGLGDINGDGFADVGVGAPGWSGGEAFEGAVFVFHGSATGLSTTPDLVLEADVANAAFGKRIASAGDVNGDGYSDVLVATPNYTNGESLEGAAFLYLGGPGGLNPVPVWQTESNLADGRYGWRLAGGDLNGDGYADIAISAAASNSPDDSFVWIFHGGPFGPLQVPDVVLHSSTSALTFGLGMTLAGDINGDGFSDLAIEGWTGSMTGVYFGSPSGVATTPNVTFQGSGQLDSGDINGDGYADIVEGAINGFDVHYTHGANGVARDRSVELRRLNASTTPIARLGMTDDDTQFRFHAQPPKWYGLADYRVEIEVKPYGVPFDGLGTEFRGPWAGNLSIIEWYGGLVPGTLYHWRTRHWYDPIKFPGFLHGPWLPAPDNAWSEPDFRTSGNAMASAVPDGNMVSGTPLTVAMNDNGPMGTTIQLVWGESCGGEATDYAIYIGDIGNFTSHVPCTCSTGGLTAFEYPPDPFKDQYYLIVPVNKSGQREGSYGVDGGGIARPASLAACYPTGQAATCNP